MTRLLAEQAYYKIIREVDSITQRNTEQKRVIYLYEDRIATKYREFHIDHVIDISYRFIGKQGGLLYLHTNKGLFSYPVKSSPEEFVKAFKGFKGII
ncbi:hypothetical protein [Oceanobacillus sp. FSL H7-0719]|uniref:hypothetical protein n=1 Tax=Oceanobacillus sp. FSL H7-0719 TaxID=2954507 RepID=UPI003247ECE5